MASFLKNLKSTKFDSNLKKMPSRHRPNEDPFKRINNWDDGFEYIHGGDASWDWNPGPIYSPPPPAPTPPPHPKPTRRFTYEPDYVRNRHAYPSPPQSDDGIQKRHRRPARRSPSPPRRRDRYRDFDDHPPTRPHLDSRYTTPLPRARDNMRPYSRSHSSPPRRSDRDYDRDRRRHEQYYNRDPSPPRRTNSTRHKDSYRTPDYRRDSYYADDYYHDRPTTPHSSNDSWKKYPPRAGDNYRPPLSRSKTTSSADAARAKAGIAGISPRWQKAAQAALKAGSVAAYQMRSQPGGWSGEKGVKVAAAALGAAAMDAFLRRDKDGGNRDRERHRDRDRGYGWSGNNNSR